MCNDVESEYEYETKSPGPEPDPAILCGEASLMSEIAVRLQFSGAENITSVDPTQRAFFWNVDLVGGTTEQYVVAVRRLSSP